MDADRSTGDDLHSRVVDDMKEEAMTAMVGDIAMMEPVTLLVPERREMKEWFGWVWGVQSEGLVR